MVKVFLAFSAVALLSLTLTLKVEVVAVDDGVPEISPAVAQRRDPAGRLPVTTFHLNGGVPPVACSVAE